MLAKFSVKKPFTVFVAVILIIILGVVSFTNMTPDLLPSIEYPMAIIVTSYAGASPEEVENDVTKPLEQNMATLDNIKSVSSTSSPNVSMVILEFTDGANMDTVTVNMREKIEIVRGGWENSMIGSPFILKINPDMIPVTVGTVEREGLSTLALSSFVGDTLMTQLEGIEGVAAVNVSGSIEESVHIVLNQDKINAVNADLRAAIEQEFDGYEDGIRSGLGAAYGGRSQALAGKDAIAAGQAQLAEKMETARGQLEAGREQLLALQAGAPAIMLANQTITAGREGMAVRRQEIADETGLTGEELDSACLADETYLGYMGQVNLAVAGLGQFQITEEQLATVVAELPGIPEKLAAIDTALSDLNVQESLMLSQLGNTYADATAGAMMLEVTIAQLQSALEQIETQQQAAFDTADLTGMLTISMVSQILTAQNFSMPAGYMGSEQDQYLVSVGDKFESVDEMRDMVLMDMGFDDLAPIKLGDVADVFTMDNSAEVYAKINGNDGILLSFSKQSGYATATVSDNINRRFEELGVQYEGLVFTPLMDQGDYIGLVIGSVLNNLLVGAFLAIVILFVFLRDLRPTLITALSIPISVTFAIVLMYFSGISLNIISLAGLAVGVGMLVDNSIVVIENIYRLRALGYPPLKAAMSGAAQVSGAITASTLTTICVFAPIVFVEGLTRQLFVDMALTIAYSLLASLVIALTLVPATASGLLKRDVNPAATSGRAQKFVEKYKASIQYALDHKLLFVLVSVGLLLVSGAVSISKGFEYMPEMAGSEVMIMVDMPEDYEMADSVRDIDALSEKIAAVEHVHTVGAMMGDGIGSVIGLSSSSETDTTSVTMYALIEGNHTRRAQEEIMDVCNEFPHLDITVNGASTMSSFTSAMGGEGVSLRVYGSDTDDLRTAAQQISALLEGVEGIAEVSSSVENAQPEIRITVDKNKAMENSLTVAQVYMNMSDMLAKSQQPIELVYNGEGHDVVVKSEANAELTIGDIRNATFTVETYSGEKVTVALKDIATIEESETMASIARSEQRRYLTVTGTVEEGSNATLVAAEMKSVVDEYVLPAGISLEYTGESETIMSALGDLMLMLLLGVVFVYFIMVAQFQSLLSPFIVMFTIPLAFTGGLLALILCGMEISIVAMIGFIMLVGIIVNNGIVLIDYINTLRREGMARREAIVEACVTRLRPIIMTALTTVLGLLPLAIGVGMGGELMQPVAVVCIGGLIYATIMTVFIVPVMYDAFNKKELRVVKDEDLEVVDA